MSQYIAYRYEVWSRDYTPFTQVLTTPVMRTRVKKVKWLWAYYGHYHHPEEARIDKVRLKSIGFSKIVLVKIQYG